MASLSIRRRLQVFFKKSDNILEEIAVALLENWMEKLNTRVSKIIKSFFDRRNKDKRYGP